MVNRKNIRKLSWRFWDKGEVGPVDSGKLSKTLNMEISNMEWKWPDWKYAEEESLAVSTYVAEVKLISRDLAWYVTTALL